ncbi:hypothetical protein MKEN_00971100 [Mycena kentingensis (nom. inval.)]|nr:hypothetical protein MKEN_00971100 [Mycena kentingensis (nom. inval.)]
MSPPLYSSCHLPHNTTSTLNGHAPVFTPQGSPESKPRSTSGEATGSAPKLAERAEEIYENIRGLFAASTSPKSLPRPIQYVLDTAVQQNENPSTMALVFARLAGSFPSISPTLFNSVLEAHIQQQFFLIWHDTQRSPWPNKQHYLFVAGLVGALFSAGAIPVRRVHESARVIVDGRPCGLKLEGLHALISFAGPGFCTGDVEARNGAAAFLKGLHATDASGNKFWAPSESDASWVSAITQMVNKWMARDQAHHAALGKRA